MKNRRSDLTWFYELLQRLQEISGGHRLLSESVQRTGWPSRGVYFFMENGEHRTDSGSGLRIVRVGTHGLKPGSSSTLWQRLSQHRGTSATGGGNHRGSIFRLLVGTTLVEHETACPTWGEGATAKGEIRAQEHATEQQVSALIGAMPFLHLSVDDDPGPDSLRGYIERNSIALLSNFQRPPLDPPSVEWRGFRCDRERVRLSGLWNQNHVHEDYAPAFLQTLEALIDRSTPTL